MEKVEYRGIAMGGRIYSLRVAKGMTQEQLAAELCVSPAAVSKWERNLSSPNIEMLWALADFFDCSIDGLVGRTETQVERVGIYDDEKFRLVTTAEALRKCAQISRAEGLLSMEEAVRKMKCDSKFLSFAVSYIMNLFMKQLDLDMSFRFLENYVMTLPEVQQMEGRMIAAVLKMIFSGERPEIIEELIVSYIGIEYREKMGSMEWEMKMSRQEIINRFKEKKMYSEATGLLEGFEHRGNFEIQVILRNLDNVTLTAALAGVSGAVAVAFLSNLSDRMLSFISEDIEHWATLLPIIRPSSGRKKGRDTNTDMITWSEGRIPYPL